MNFPVVLKTEELREPQAAVFYEVAENGVFQVRSTPIYRAVTRAVGPIPGLMPEAESLIIKFPRLPRAQIEEVLAFFDEVYRRDRGEAVVVIFYSVDQRAYRIAVPQQTLSGRQAGDGSWRADYAVRYGAVSRPDGFVRFGTIHSHADLPAYSSGLDCDDERYEDGLHVVFGSFADRELTIVASFVANGIRFKIPPADVLEPCKVPARAANREWMACVRREERKHEAVEWRRVPSATRRTDVFDGGAADHGCGQRAGSVDGKPALPPDLGGFGHHRPGVHAWPAPVDRPVRRGCGEVGGGRLPRIPDDARGPGDAAMGPKPAGVKPRTEESRGRSPDRNSRGPEGPGPPGVDDAT